MLFSSHVLRPVVGLSMLLVSSYAVAKGTVEVNVVFGVRERVQSIGILPANCPDGIDCLEFERDVFDLLNTYRGLRVSPAKLIRRVMFDRELESLDEEAATVLRDALSVDAFLIPVWGFHSSAAAGSLGARVWVWDISADFTMERIGDLTLLLVDANTNKVLMQGVGYGKSDWQDENGLARKLVGRMLREAFGKPNSDWGKKKK